MKPGIKHILSILQKPEKRKFFTVTACNILISVLDITAIALLLVIIDFYTIGRYTGKLTSLISRHTSSGSLWLIGVFLLFFLVKNTCAYLVHRMQYRFVYRVASRISGMNMLQYLEGNFRDHAEIDSSIWIKRISQQPVEFSHYILSGLQQMITETVLIILSIIAILLFKARIFLILLVLLVPAVLFLSLFVRARLRKTRQMVKKDGEKSLQHLKEALDGYVESNLYRKNRFFSQRYSQYQDELNTHLSELQAIQGAPSRFIEVFAIAGLFFLILIYKTYEGSQVVDIITIGAFIGAAYKIIPGIVKVLNTSTQMRTYAYTIDAVKRWELPGEIGDAQLTTQPLIDIEFRSVGFSFHEKPVFSTLSFTLEKGVFAGITGDSGKGKSTLVNILLGFLEAEKGQILFNGQTTSASVRRNYWHEIAYVKQQPFIIHDTILANITMEEEKYDAPRLQEAILHAGLTGLVNSFPEGIHKIVNEQGRNFSGGQRQRIAIARAFYKNASVLILDEPFNELDHDAEKQLLKHLQYLTESGKIIILITHNRESLTFCNTIISVDEKS